MTSWFKKVSQHLNHKLHSRILQTEMFNSENCFEIYYSVGRNLKELVDENNMITATLYLIKTTCDVSGKNVKRLLKTLWEKKKILVTSIFSSSTLFPIYSVRKKFLSSLC